jgi:hypothetical protein
MAKKPTEETELRNRLKPRKDFPRPVVKGRRLYMTARDIRAFVFLLRERFPEIVFFIVDNDQGYLRNWQPIKDPSQFCDRDVWAFLPEGSASERPSFHPRETQEHLRRKHFCVRANGGIFPRTYDNGRRVEFMSFGWLQANHMRTDKETARFLATVWRLSAKISTNHMKEIDPKTNETLADDIDLHVNRFGFDALRWCAEMDTRCFELCYRPVDGWVMPDLPCYEQT